MGTASLEFLLFALAAVALSNLSKALLWRQTVLLLASLAFLSFFSHDPAAWIPLAAFLAFGYWSVRSMQSARGPARFTPVVVPIIVAFVWLKKYAFIPAPLLLHRPYVTLGFRISSSGCSISSSMRTAAMFLNQSESSPISTTL